MAGENVKQHFNKDTVSEKYHCKFCGRDFAAGTSVTRLRAHLAGLTNAGARKCPRVPPHVKESLPIESSNKRQKTQKALPDNFPSSSFAQLPNNFGNQRGVQLGLPSAFQIPMRGEEMEEVHQDYVPNFEPGQTTGNIVVEDYLNDGNIEEAFAYIETCSLPNDGWISYDYQKSLEDQTNEDTMVENESNLQHGEIARSMEGATPENQTGSNRVSPTADVLTDEADQNGVQRCEGRVHVEVPSAEVSSVQMTRREGIVQRSNKRHRSSDEVTVQQAAQMTRREGILQSSNERQALSKGEAWILFTQELGNYRTEVEELAKAVSRECAGLPLGIRVMARSMNGICDVHTWRKTLEELKELKVSNGQEMREEVFSVLKFSYLQLKDSALQECLSYCALFPEDARIDRNDLIEYMIIEGIIEERKSRQGHTMLDTLENACLLEGDTQTVWMHHLIRDMLILELREGSKTLVEAGAQLKGLPGVEKWTENLVRVSLMHNDIEVIPSGHTPNCPNLSTLLLCRNHRLKMIADSFIEQFQRLKILDLTLCQEIEKLPTSISDLLNLTALLLSDCRSLIHVPSLAKLEKLKKLDLSRYGRLKQMPEGVRFLLNLKYLDLSRTGIEEIGSGIIPMLSRLQVLKLCGEWGDSELSFRGSEVGGLRMLETLHCKFSDLNEFREYMKSRERSKQSPSDYSIFIKRENPYWPTTSRKFVSVTDYRFIDFLALPTDIETLNIYNCYSTLCKRLLASLLNLQEIRVYEEEDGEWREFPFSNYSIHCLPRHSLLHLKLINICNCDKLKKLFPPCLLPNLRNLQTIWVEFCDGMEEIFSTDQEEDGQELSFDQPNLTGLNLSRLTKLKLRYLPELRSIYTGAVICQSLQEIELRNCPKLQRITLPLPQPSLQRIHVYPKKWWDSVQWGSANDKNHLKSLFL